MCVRKRETAGERARVKESKRAREREGEKDINHTHTQRERTSHGFRTPWNSVMRDTYAVRVCVCVRECIS